MAKKCKIKVGSNPGQIKQERFSTEAGYDELTVPIDNKDHIFSGDENVEVKPDRNGIITWSSDYSVRKTGFKLCMTLAPSVRWKLGTTRQSCTAVCKKISKRCDEGKLRSVKSKAAIESAAAAAGVPCKATRGWAYNNLPGMCTDRSCCGGKCVGTCAYGDHGKTRTCAGAPPGHYSRLCPCV